MSNVLGNCQECGEMKPCDCGFGGFNADADPTPAEALKAGAKPWGFYFWRSNGDGTSSPDFVKGEIPDYKRDVRNVVPLYTRPPPDAGEVRTYREGVEMACRAIPAIVAAATRDEWDAICNDTGRHPADIFKVGRQLFYRHSHWTNRVGEAVEAAIRKLP